MQGMIGYLLPARQTDRERLDFGNVCSRSSAPVYSGNKVPRFAKLHLISGGLALRVACSWASNRIPVALER